MNHSSDGGRSTRSYFSFDINESSSRYGGICNSNLEELLDEDFPNPQIRRIY